MSSKEIFKADHLCTTQKLPRGIRFVQLPRPDKNPICCKLPKTESHQNWCTINTEVEESVVKCPDSGIALKIDMLRKCVELANKENNNIFVPINLNAEYFQVLAVGGLETHVFAGPFGSELNQDSGHESTPPPLSR